MKEHNADTPVIRVGAMLTVIPTAPVKSGQTIVWAAICNDLTEGWSCELVHRADSELIPGLPLACWVLWVDTSNRQLRVSDSNFGFLPISERMRPRYVSALRRVAALIEENSNLKATANDADALSEVKGMFSQCARRDQWDWHAVHVALGEPPFEVLRQAATILGEIAKALRKEEFQSAHSLFSEVVSFNLLPLIKKAIGLIAESAPRLAKSRALYSRENKSAQSEVEVSVMSAYSKSKLITANATHAHLLSILGSFLSVNGHRVEANQFVDAFTILKSGPAIFEAKSLTNDNELTQVRHGLSQLYEYRFRHNLGNASLWLILSRPLEESWLIDYLESDRGVNVVWLEDGKLAGAKVDRLLESGSSVLRRYRGE